MKSYRSLSEHQDALRQAASYASQLGLVEVALAFFVDTIDEPSRTRYEAAHLDTETGVTVTPTFVTTG